jgi:hypothetical protein
MSAILRHRHPNRFTVLPNDAIRNPALSYRAVGVLAHLLSLPDGAKVDSATLAQAHKEGRDAVRAAFCELADHGYYRRDIVRLPDGTLRTEVVVSSTPMNNESAGGTGAGKSGVGPEPGNPASAEPAPVNPTSAGPTPGGPTPVGQATTEVPTTENLDPPQPPRPAGGPEVESVTPTAHSRRAAGTNPRAQRANPRVAAELAEAARLEAEAQARRAELERRTETRRAAALAAEAETARLEAEALALSAALDDSTLTRIVAAVSDGLPGPLARSPMGLSRAVVAWCRTAAHQHAGPLADAVAAGLAAGLAVGEGDAPALHLLAAPPDTPTLRQRIAQLLHPVGGE